MLQYLLLKVLFVGVFLDNSNCLDCSNINTVVNTWITGEANLFKPRLLLKFPTP